MTAPSSTSTERPPRRQGARALGRLTRLAPVLTLCGAILGVSSWTAVRLVRATAGHLSFTVDDSHIHLRLAQQIANGTYGINPGEAAAPSSSPLWPFLLAPFGRQSWLPWVPLVVNVVCTVVLAVVVHRIIHLGWRAWDRSGWLSAGAALLVVLATGAIPLAFTGMEHSLHALVALAVVLGVFQRSELGRAPRWLWPALAVLPLIRYEGLLLVLVMVVTLALLGEARRAAASAAAGLAGLVCFALLLTALGLPPVPTSVLTKAAGRGDLSWPQFVWDNLAAVATQTGNAAVAPLIAVALALMLCLLIMHLGGRSLTDGAVLISAAALLVLAYQLGTDPLTRRYVACALVLGSTVAVGVALPRLRQLGSRWIWMPAGLLLVAILVFGAARFRGVLTGVPFAGQSIHAQQYQMHRFVEELGLPVAVNDLGHVSYDSSNEVLDLIGLADEQVRQLRSSGGSDWLAPLLAERGVDVAVIYSEWFEGEIPSDWELVGRIRTVEGGAPAFHEVDIWASPSATDRARTALGRFVPSDPEWTEVQTFPAG